MTGTGRSGGRARCSGPDGAAASTPQYSRPSSRRRMAGPPVRGAGGSGGAANVEVGREGHDAGAADAAGDVAEVDAGDLDVRGRRSGDRDDAREGDRLFLALVGSL